jgi:hypothetical protein
MFAMTDGEWTFPAWFIILALIVIFALVFVPWLSLAYWAGRVAERKGRSFGGYFILGLVMYPLSFATAVQFESQLPCMLMLPLPILSAYLVDDRRYVHRSPNSRWVPGQHVE